jgi:PAS domain-containing protein
MKDDKEGLEGLIEGKKAKLQESEELYRTLFDTMAEGVVLINTDGEIVHANLGAQAF